MEENSESGFCPWQQTCGVSANSNLFPHTHWASSSQFTSETKSSEVTHIPHGEGSILEVGPHFKCLSQALGSLTPVTIWLLIQIFFDWTPMLSKLSELHTEMGTLYLSVQFSHSVVSDSLRPHEPQHARPPCPSPTPGVIPNPCPLSWWCHPTISSSVVPFSSCPQSFQHQGLFKWVSSMHQVAKVLKLQLQNQSYQWTPRTDNCVGVYLFQKLC